MDACNEVIKGTRWYRPLNLVISCTAMKTLQLLLSEPHKQITDVFVKDDGGSNILHALILSSKLTKQEDEFIKLYNYIMSTLDFKTKKSLLMEENNTKLRPLELSVTSAQLGLFQVGNFRMLSKVNSYRHIKCQTSKSLICY